ncbi:MAG: hypothetical protein AB2A00_17975 [Myxococcota bacterium]
MTDAIGSKTRRAIGRALTNDRNAVVSQADARKIVAAALSEIGRSKAPEQVYEKSLQHIQDARRFVGGDGDAGEVLQEFETKGRSAVEARLTQITGNAQLPITARDAFKTMVSDYDLAQGSVDISDVKGSERSGFEFTWKAGGEEHTAFAVKFQGEWVFSPVKVTKEQLEKAMTAFQQYFDENWAPEILDGGATRAEVRAMRADLRPTRVFFPGESDPQDLVSSYPLVFQINNAVGSDHGCYVGLNPDTGETEAYTFN